MRVLLISPNSRKKPEEEIPVITPPLNLMYLAEIIKNDNLHVKILDGYALNMDSLRIIKFAKKFQPDTVLIPLYSRDLLNVHNLTSALKEQNPNTTIILGGHHASQMPDTVLKESSQIDFILRGEAEQTIIPLLHAINNLRKLKNVKGLSYRKGKDQKIIHNKLPTPIKDLDSIPIPSRDMIIQKNYYSLSKENLLDVIVTSRRCPFSCSFCSKIDKRFNFYRMRSPENIVEELREILDHGAKSIEIRDDAFTIDKKRCLKLIDLVKKEKMDFEFRMCTRVDFIDAKLLKKLKSINCTTICYGVESGNQRILDLNGKRFTLSQVRCAFEITRKVKIDILGFFLIGFLQDTPSTIKETINFAKKLNPKHVRFSWIRPFPGTRIYTEAKKNNMLVGDWSIYQDVPWIKLPWAKSVNDLEGCVDMAYHEFHYRPRFIFDFLKDTIEKRNWFQLSYALKHFLKNMPSGFFFRKRF